ncbi:uncharacterized protein SOCE26_088200 [Sorangium cellulosum]|uniref:Uncharacterized protein n=1 Tax=Sorangium cellulosum TaxID=56 RepID=A0A2L0F6Z7_SORCE|nr:hypothetical protein [Sorangium cellulosum]AUX47302.1 uncharacterized protein SOCE26_088200 [Sorangium cellulosum]
MAKIPVYETFCTSDIEALLDSGITVNLAFDASHNKQEKSVHLELLIDASHQAIQLLRSRHNDTYIKLKGALIQGEGTYKLECHHIEQGIVDSSPKSYEIRQNRAIVRHGDVGTVIQDIAWW